MGAHAPAGEAGRARVVRASGMLVEARPLFGAALHEVVAVGPRALTGEVIRVEGDRATIQVYEDTTGLALGSVTGGTGSTGGLGAWALAPSGRMRIASRTSVGSGRIDAIVGRTV